MPVGLDPTLSVMVSAAVFKYGINSIVVVIVLYVLVFWLPRSFREIGARRSATADRKPRLTKAGYVLSVLVAVLLILVAESVNTYIENHPGFILYPLANWIGAHPIALLVGYIAAIASFEIVSIGLKYLGVPLVRDEGQNGDDDCSTGTTTSSQESVRPPVGIPVVLLLSFLAMAVVNMVWRPQQGDTTLLIVLASSAGLIGFFSALKGNRDLRSKLWIIVAIVMAILTVYEFCLLASRGNHESRGPNQGIRVVEIQPVHGEFPSHRHRRLKQPTTV